MKYLLLIFFYGRVQIIPFDDVMACAARATYINEHKTEDVQYARCVENWPVKYEWED